MWRGLEVDGKPISADEPKSIEPFSRLTAVHFARLVALVRRRGGDVQRGRPWRLPLEDRVLLPATYWRTNLTLRQVAPLFGVSKAATDRILDHLVACPADFAGQSTCRSWPGRLSPRPDLGGGRGTSTEYVRPAGHGGRGPEAPAAQHWTQNGAGDAPTQSVTRCANLLVDGVDDVADVVLTDLHQRGDVHDRLAASGAFVQFTIRAAFVASTNGILYFVDDAGSPL